MLAPDTHPTSAEIRVDDLDAAQRLITALYGKASIGLPPGARGPFSWQVKRTSIGPMTLIAGHLESGCEAHVEEMAARYVLLTNRRGDTDLSLGAGRYAIEAGKTALMASPGATGRALSAPGTRTLNIAVEQSALSAHLSALTGAATHAPPRFALHLDLRSSAGAALQRLIQFIHEASESAGGVLGSAHVLVHLREALMSAMLAGIESTASHLFQRSPPGTSRRAVRQAEEYLAAHASEPVAISDLAALTGVGLRSLERSFRAVHGCSIRAFLTSTRLELARRHLLTAAPGTTITQIVYASGFSHPGKFSLAYRGRFGESPSETLRRAGGDKGIAIATRTG